MSRLCQAPVSLSLVFYKHPQGLAARRTRLSYLQFVTLPLILHLSSELGVAKAVVNVLASLQTSMYHPPQAGLALRPFALTLLGESWTQYPSTGGSSHGP
jgi:hypothetical protein